MKQFSTKGIYLIKDIVQFKLVRILPCKSVQILLSHRCLKNQAYIMNGSIDNNTNTKEL
jgi:hypothetical protein